MLKEQIPRHPLPAAMSALFPDFRVQEVQKARAYETHYEKDIYTNEAACVWGRGLPRWMMERVSPFWREGLCFSYLGDISLPSTPPRLHKDICRQLITIPVIHACLSAQDNSDTVN